MLALAQQHGRSLRFVQGGGSWGPPQTGQRQEKIVIHELLGGGGASSTHCIPSWVSRAQCVPHLS